MASQVTEAGAANAGALTTMQEGVLRALADYQFGARPRDLAGDVGHTIPAILNALFVLDEHGLITRVDKCGLVRLTTMGWAVAT